MPWAVLHGDEAPAKGGGCQGSGRHPRGPSWVLPDAESDVNELILSWTHLGGARDASSEWREPHLGPPRAGRPSQRRSRALRTRRPEILLACPCPSPQGDQTRLRDPCFCSGPSLWAAGRDGRVIPDLLLARQLQVVQLGKLGVWESSWGGAGIWAGDGRFSSASPLASWGDPHQPQPQWEGKRPRGGRPGVGGEGVPLLPRNPALPGAPCFQPVSFLLEIPWRPAGFDVWKATCSLKGWA